MFEETQEGLRRNAPVHSIHGSLLAVGELLRLVNFFYLIFFKCYGSSWYFLQVEAITLYCLFLNIMGYIN